MTWGWRRLGALILAIAAPVVAQTAPGPYVGTPEKLVDAKPGELRVFATAALLQPLEAIRDKVQPAVGRPVRIEYGSARGNLKTQILGGEAFDVAILLPDVICEIRAQGKAGKRDYPIARIPVAMGLRGDAPAPDVATPAALKTALLGARSVKYAPTGAARDTVNKILSTLDVADRIHDSSALRAPVPLGAGEYEIALYPISEILQNHDLRNLGMVPAPLQVPARLVAVVAPGADPTAARAFIRFLQGPMIDPQLRAGGMTKAN